MPVLGSPAYQGAVAKAGHSGDMGEFESPIDNSQETPMEDDNIPLTPGRRPAVRRTLSDLSNTDPENTPRQKSHKSRKSKNQNGHSHRGRHH